MLIPDAPTGQIKVLSEVARLVDAWRGYPLGRAVDPYPTAPPRYEPTSPGERALTPTTLSLLLHWFRREPHTLGRPPATYAFKYWPHQRRLVETFIYLYEVRGLRRTEEIYALAAAGKVPDQRDPWAKLGGQLATGSGKTKMMSLLIAWAYLNAVREPQSGLGFGRHSIVIAPGLFVRDRLMQDFFPPDQSTPVFWADPVIPPELESAWDLQVYSPATCPLKLDPEQGALVVTNYHQLLRTRDDAPDMRRVSPAARQIELLFEDGEPSKLEAVQSPLMERFARSHGLLVLNDEAHHVWDETGHAQFEQKAKDRAKPGAEDADTAMAWIRCLRNLNGSRDLPGRVALQVDLSATLFQEQGAKKTTAKVAGYDSVAFRSVDLFRHTVVRYGLADAIRDGIVKKPILELVTVRDNKTGFAEALIDIGAPDAWARYRNLLATGIERWKKVRDQFAAEGDRRKPILFILCNDRKEAREIANFLTHGQAVQEDLSGLVPVGYLDTETGARLFVDKDAAGNVRSSVIEIHIGQKEESNEIEWEKVRQAVNAIDHDEIRDPDPNGPKDDAGKRLMVPNPYNVVVSVMMLKEGWDVRNVKVIVPTRPCDSRTLTEQTLGRGLRKMHAPVIDDEGAVELKGEELYVMQHPSFKQIIHEIEDLVEVKSGDEIDHRPEYVPVELTADLAAREALDVRLVRFDGVREVKTDWYKTFDVRKLPDLKYKLPWKVDLPEKDIQTFLQKALAAGQEEGQHFTLEEAYTYTNFDHVAEVAYVRPMLKEMRASFQHKTHVKEVVKAFLEKKTFALPRGVALSFDSMIGTEDGPIAFGNLARAEVIQAVKAALMPPLQTAISAERPAEETNLVTRRTVDLGSYQAVRRHVLQAPRKSAFTCAAMDSNEERRVALLLDGAVDVTGWVYNHRQGVGYSITYEWHGYTSHYFPDFIARARLGAMFHNFIIEVKGRLDDRDKKKAVAARRYCELLTEHDKEPWHYVLLIENDPGGRSDVTWWEQRSVQELGQLLRHHESLPLYPDDQPLFTSATFTIVPSVPAEDQYQRALPVFDLAVAAGAFSASQSPEPLGWAQVTAKQERFDRRMFVARVVGESMEPGVPDGSWAIFRAFPAGTAPPPIALDGRRVIVELRDEEDPETGGQYTFKRWHVTKLSPEGHVEEIELRPDNRDYKARKLRPEDGEVRAVAELLEVVESP